MKRRLSGFAVLCLLSLLLSCASARAQGGFVVRITEKLGGRNILGFRQVCTVLTPDGRLQRQVTSRSRTGFVYKPDVFEGIASTEDVNRLKELVTNANFQAAAQQNSQHGSSIQFGVEVISVETNITGKMQTVIFVDVKGQTSTPPYLAGFVSFADQVRKRKFPKLKVPVEPICDVPTRVITIY